MTRSLVDLDHVFLFVPDEHSALDMMAGAGLRVNYSRIHKGQGTRNLCACLDDMFLELLWLDGSEISPESERITLGARGRGQGSPIGVAWRGHCDLDCEPYAAPFLPAGKTIPVARASLDPNMPFIFCTPGGTKPIDRVDGFVGDRQFPALTSLDHCELRVPNPGSVGALLTNFDRIGISLGASSLGVRILDANGNIGRSFTWAGVSGS